MCHLAKCIQAHWLTSCFSPFPSRKLAVRSPLWLSEWGDHEWGYNKRGLHFMSRGLLGYDTTQVMGGNYLLEELLLIFECG